MYLHRNRPHCESSLASLTNRIIYTAATVRKWFVMKQQVQIPSVRGPNIAGAISQELE